MKSMKIALIALLCTLSLGLNAQEPFFTEGFESGAKPAGWSEEYSNGTEPWRFRKGGHSPSDNNWLIPPHQTDITRNPSSSHSGSYNAIFFKQSMSLERTKLVTRAIDLSQRVRPELSVWICQVPWNFSGNTNWDVLRVYYKTTPDGTWHLLAEYLDPIEEWTEFKINLPNPSATYYIAFEGETKWGYGACIDDIAIVDKGQQAKYVSELTVEQADHSFVPAGSLNEPILKLGLRVFGNTGEAVLNSLVVKSNNTDDSDIAPSGVRLYQTATATFSTATPVGSGGNFNNGYLNFSNLNLTLPSGQSYLWLTYDVKASATHGHLLDAMIEMSGIQVGDSLYPKVAASPVGERIIYETIHRQDFDGAHGWDLTGEFQVAAPQQQGGAEAGFPDPASAFSGTKVLGTDLTGLGNATGDYENNLDEAQAYRATSTSINALFYKDLKVNYRRHLNTGLWDRANLDVSRDNGVQWSNVWSSNDNYFADQAWSKTSHDIPASVSRSSNLKFRFVLGPTDAATTYSGWNVDDLVVTGDHITKDVGVVELVYPTSGCGHSATDSVIVKIANLGAEASPEVVPVQYSFNNGASWVTNFLNQSIQPGETVEFKFSTKVNLSAPGLKQFKARTRLQGDEDASNDEFASSVYIVPTYQLPFAEPFESNNGYWRTSGTPLWEWGTPTKPSVVTSTKAWVTSLTQPYGDILLGSTEPVAVFAENFESTSTGWTLNGEFQIAAPAYTHDDIIPYYTYGGEKCLGTDLTGLGAITRMYEKNTTVDAISPLIDITNYANLALSYQKWHRVAAGDMAEIQARNGTAGAWQTIWSNAGNALNDKNWTEETISIPSTLVNGNNIQFRFLITSNNDNDVAEGLNFDDMTLNGTPFTSDFAYLQSPCFDFTGVSKPVFDLSVFSHSEANVDGSTLQYSLNGGNTWTYVDNTDTHDTYWNWYTGSNVSAIGKPGWNGAYTEWKNSKHLLPEELSGKESVIFRVAFKSDKANNSFGGTAIDNVKLYSAPHDVGVTAINTPSTACNLSNQEEIKFIIRNFGIRPIPIGDSILVRVDVTHASLSNSHTDTIILASALAPGATLNHTVSQKFDFSVSGEYTIVARTIIETNPLFYSATDNDATTKTVIVQKPHVELGPDIYTLTPTSVTLKTANSDPNITYKWYKYPNLTNPISTSPTLNVADANGGKYRVVLTNDIPCTATDEITVHKLIRDVGIAGLESPVSACELSETTPFTVYVKNFGTDTLKAGTTIDLKYTFQSNLQVNQSLVLKSDLFPQDTLKYTFDETLNLANTGAYTLNVEANVALDENPSNNVSNQTINVWGYPTFSLQNAMGLPSNTVSVVNTSYTVDAGPSWNAYLWLNDNSTEQTYTMTNSGWARVTVFDSHSCPATDSIYVDLSFADISPSEVLRPTSACRINGTTAPQILIKNSGGNVIPSGTQITLKYFLNDELKQSTELTLSANLEPGATRNVTFTNGVDISEAGVYNFTFVATFTNDERNSNDTLKHTVHNFGLPALSMSDSVFTRNTSYTLDAGSGHESYSWSTGETSQQITVTQSGKYKVTVVDNGICSSKDSTVVTFLKHNYTVSEVLNPKTSCASLAPQSVTLRYSNTGNDTLATGQKIKLGYSIDDEFFAEETLTLTSKLKPGQFLLHTFSEKHDLSAPRNRQVTAYGVYAGDTHTGDDTLKVSFEIKESPVVDLGEDRVVRVENITLDGGEGIGYTYQWQNNSTDRFFIVESTGTYWVTTTAPNGCFDRDTVNIKVVRPDIRVSSILTPSTACVLSNAEQIKVEVENVGTDTLFVGQTINLSYEVNNTLQQTQGIILTQKFRPGDSFQHTFTKTFDMSGIATYIIKSYTTYAGDLNPFNNSLSKTVIMYGSPIVDLGPNRGVCDGSSLTLDAGNPRATYLWSTGSTEQTISVTAAGAYSVTVTDENGCSNNGSVTIHVNPVPTVTHAPLATVCFSEPPITLTGGNPAGGTYSGNGVSDGIFTASTAGVGTHTLLYTYTDDNGCAGTAPVNITVREKLNVDLGPDRSITAPLTLDAGAGFVSYLWQDNSTNQTYTVQATGLYHVTVTDANGCKGYDEVSITFLETSDIIVSKLVSPTTSCLGTTPSPVTFEIRNRGTKTFTSGEKISLRYRIGSGGYVTEELTFTSSFAQNNTMDYTFSSGVNLASGNHTFTCYTIINGEKGDSLDHSVTIHPLPNFSFAQDTIRVSASNINGYVLSSGVNYPIYTWSTGATSPNITINQHGKYWLKVTNANGCSQTDTVVVWYPVNTEIIPGTNATIKLFPNPVKDVLNILIESEKEYAFTIEVMNPQGVLVRKQQTLPLSSVSGTVDMDGLVPGMYLLRVSSERGSAVFKIVLANH